MPQLHAQHWRTQIQMNHSHFSTAARRGFGVRTFSLITLLALMMFALGACAGIMDDAMTDGSSGADASASAGADSADGGGGVSGDSAGVVDSDSATPEQESHDQSGTAVPGSVDDLEVNVGDRVFFATDRSDLDSAAQETLRRQAAWLQRYPEIVVRIEGHADERGTREYNLALSQRRANETREYLVGLGIASSRISIIPYGKERPLALCSNENCWKQNRRAVTTVVAPGT